MPSRDPVSSFLFILFAEFLGIPVRNHKNLNGIIINQKEHKLSKYANDTLFLLDGTGQSLNVTFSELHQFADFSGLTVNFDV